MFDQGSKHSMDSFSHFVDQPPWDRRLVLKRLEVRR